MATGKFGSASAFILVDGYDLLGSKIKDLRYKDEAMQEKSTGIGDSFESKLPTGIRVLSLTQVGAFFDTATNGAHTALVTVASSPQGSRRIITFGFGGTALGDPFTGAEGAYSQSYEVLSKVGDLTKANPTYGIYGQVDQGVILHPLGAETVDTNGTSVDNGAASTNGGAAILQVKAFSGLSSAVFTVADSANNSAFSTIATFATVTSAPTAERIALAGTIRQYTRYVVDVTGTGSVTFMVGLARG